MANLVKGKKPGGQYLRYLLSYMTVLFIPLIILTFFYSSRFMKKFYEEIYETVDLELVQINTQLENEMESMQSIVNQLALTQTIHQAASASSPPDLASVITSLSGFVSSNIFIDDIVLVLNDNDYVITNTTTCKKDYFFTRFLSSATTDIPDLQQMIQNSTMPLCLPPENLSYRMTGSAPADTVLFTYPLYTDYQKREGTALFFVKTSSIQGFLSQKLQTYHAQTYIMDQVGNIIITSGSNDVMRSYLSNPRGNILDSSTKNIIDQQNYVMRTYQSNQNGWLYVAFIPDRQTTFSQVSDIMKEFIGAIAIILLLASLTIYFLQKINYAPVRRLRDKAKEFSPNQTSTDELVTISNALDYLFEQNSSLSSKLEGSLMAVKNERLYRLLGGNYADNEEFNLDCSELDLSLTNPCFSVGILILHSSVSNLDSLAQEIKKQLKVPYIYYYLNYLHPNQIVLLLNLPENVSNVNGLYQEVQSWLTKEHHLLATIGIGSLVSSTDRIASSYMEAVSALDYRFVKGNGTLIEFCEVLGPGHANVVYPHQEFEMLRNALLSQNEQNIRAVIQNIIQFMDQQKLPLYLARSICFDLIHLVNEHCQKQANSLAGSPLELSGMETAHEIIQMLQAWNENLGSFTVVSPKQVDLEDVLLFLNDNCLRCEFSVYEAALQFGMTLPAFSKYFKDNFGQNVMDYTIRMRMTKAKELLKDTKLPLKDIAEQVGYYNISSFTRRFKLNQGITPGDYRKIAREDSREG